MTNPTPDAALLPCAHCGGEAYLANPDPTPPAIWRIICTNDCAAHRHVYDRAKAIAAWNCRAGQSHDAGLLEALELADAALRGANMNMNVVQRKISAAIAAAKGGRDAG
jgi:hypothetical protein